MSQTEATAKTAPEATNQAVGKATIVANKVAEQAKVIAIDFYDHLFAAVIILIAIVIMRLLRDFLWPLYAKRIGKVAPHTLMTFVNIVIVAITAMIVVVGIYEQPLISFLAVGSVIGAGFAFAMQRPLLDAFSGIVLDIESYCDVGDWIRIDNVMGCVLKHSWRATYIETLNQTTIVIPNTRLSQQMFENFSKNGGYWEFVDINMDHNIPVNRVERLIRASMLLLDKEMVIDHNVDVFADSVIEGGVKFHCRFKIISPAVLRQVRHHVIEAITENLHKYNLGVSETLGEYIISQRTGVIDWNIHPVNPVNVLQQIDILMDFNTFELSELAKSIKVHELPRKQTLFEEGDSGDSMYIIAEGAVDVLINDKTDPKKRHHVATLTQGHYFGEMVLFLNDERRATIKTSSTVVLYEINKATMLPFLQKRPDTITAVSRKIQEILEINQKQLNQTEQSETELTTLDAIKSKIMSIFGIGGA